MVTACVHGRTRQALLLNLRMVKGPLSPAETQSVIEQYNRFTSAGIPIEEFIHWVQRGPTGPAWHALLETDTGEIVGHHSLIPLSANRGARGSIPAKSEYTFLREEFRVAKIRGFESSAKPTWLILLEQHLRHCHANGWGPFLISTAPVLHRFCASIGSQRIDVPLWECLLVLRPWRAALKTPNLSRRQRLCLWLAGLFQPSAWSLLLRCRWHSSEIPVVALGKSPVGCPDDPSIFFEDTEFFRWRYLDGQYEQLHVDSEGHEYVIAKKGSADRYLRVCQWRLNSVRSLHSLIVRLVQMAKQERALGVRWAFYGNDDVTVKFVRYLGSLGLLCARRVRTLLIYPREQLPIAETWRLNDAMFSFDP